MGYIICVCRIQCFPEFQPCPCACTRDLVRPETPGPLLDAAAQEAVVGVEFCEHGISHASEALLRIHRTVSFSLIDVHEPQPSQRRATIYIKQHWS